MKLKCLFQGLLGLQNGVMPDLRDMTQLKRKREVEDEVEKGETSLEEECKRFRSQYVSPQVCISLCLKDPYLVLVFLSTCTHRHTSPPCGASGLKANMPTRRLR